VPVEFTPVELVVDVATLDRLVVEVRLLAKTVAYAVEVAVPVV
jgi:hypothetical protein